MLMRKFLFLLATMLVLSFAAPVASADPIFFSNVNALQNGGATRVDLFSNPGVTLTGPQVSFLIDITGTLPAGAANLLQITYIEAGGAPQVQIFSIPAFGIIPPPYTQLVTFTSPGADFDGVFATLTVNILGSAANFIIPSGPRAGERVNSWTYSFSVAQPIPEPATLLAFASGLVGLALRRRRW